MRRIHAALAAAYADLKRAAAERWPTDREAYTRAKGEFVARVLATAEIR